MSKLRWLTSHQFYAILILRNQKIVRSYTNNFWDHSQMLSIHHHIVEMAARLEGFREKISDVIVVPTPAEHDLARKSPGQFHNPHMQCQARKLQIWQMFMA